jgi:hypothetical protein
MSRHSTVVLFAIALSAVPSGLFGQDPIMLGDVQFSGSVRTRVESWDWFNPGSGAQNQYTFPGSILQFGISRSKKNFDWQLQFAAPVLPGLPQNAIAPGAAGQLGMGASYYAANDRNRSAAMAFVRQGYVRWKFGGEEKQSVRIGRFEFLDGAETTPADRTLLSLKKDRIAQRLLGNFGFTDVGRSMDGAEYSATRGNVNVTLLASRPTRGVFQTDGWGDLNVDVFYGVLTVAFPGKTAGELRAFGLGYVDDRNNVLKTDNRTAVARRADAGHIDLGTYGADYIRNVPTAAGSFDALLWGVVQNGSWGALRQRSYAWAAEGGWQPNVFRPVRPWLRGGVDYGSGDNNPNDSTQGTFFQILPTPRPYARMPFFNMMNMRDAFGELILQPGKRVTVRGDIHSLRLANANDLWYSGGGAFQPWTFGYTGRPSNGHTGLATLIDVSADYNIDRHFTVGVYAARAAGKLVAEGIYPKGRNAAFGYLEFGYRF